MFYFDRCAVLLQSIFLQCILLSGSSAKLLNVTTSTHLLKNELHIPEEFYFTTPQLIKKNGYPVEIHSVTTTDGYILEMHRIPHGTHPPTITGKPVVLVMHGLLCSSADWIIMGPSKGLGYILADLGYDVWIGNSRGNTYSRQHVTLDPNITGGPFWNFSWHEMGIYDTPAMIDHILATTGDKDLFYIGHSQGTTQFYVMASELPEYNDKVRAMFSLAPVAYGTHVRNPQYRLLAAADREFKGVLRSLGSKEFLPQDKRKAVIGYLVCKDEFMRKIICEKHLSKAVGKNYVHIKQDMILLLLAHTPAGSATKQVYHYAQGVSSGNFSQFDYGAEGNLKRYATNIPPAYNLSRITCPVSLHYSSNDPLAAIQDVDVLYSELPNPVGKFLVPRPEFNHVDFLGAENVKELVYDHVTDLMATFLVDKT